VLVALITASNAYCEPATMTSHLIDQFLGKIGKSIERCFINSGLNNRILTVNVPGIVQPLDERHDIFIPDSLEEADAGDLARLLLRQRRERPSGRRAS